MFMLFQALSGNVITPVADPFPGLYGGKNRSNVAWVITNYMGDIAGNATLYLMTAVVKPQARWMTNCSLPPADSPPPPILYDSPPPGIDLIKRSPKLQSLDKIIPSLPETLQDILKGSSNCTFFAPNDNGELRAPSLHVMLAEPSPFILLLSREQAHRRP